MKILILGSEGFIGSHLVSYFIEQGSQVICADIILKVAKDYILINPESPNFASLFQHQSFDVCINATGAANVQFSFSYPHTDYFLNTANVYAILDAIRCYNPLCAFINLSSAAVYGNPTFLPIHESAVIRPTSPYGVHKYYSEQICNEFYTFYNIKTLSVRIFSAYGPGLKKQLFWDLFKKVKTKINNIEVFGTGNETRDFIYIDDLVRAIDYIIKKNYFDGTFINVASGISTSIKEVVEIFLNQLNPNLSANFTGECKEGDPLYWQANIDLLKSFGFKNQISIEKGIIETVKWLKKQD